MAAINSEHGDGRKYLCTQNVYADHRPPMFPIRAGHLLSHCLIACWHFPEKNVYIYVYVQMYVHCTFACGSDISDDTTPNDTKRNGSSWFMHLAMCITMCVCYEYIAILLWLCQYGDWGDARGMVCFSIDVVGREDFIINWSSMRARACNIESYKFELFSGPLAVSLLLSLLLGSVRDICVCERVLSECRSVFFFVFFFSPAYAFNYSQRE